jgi:deoxyxylulose-5-phosphate synthase
MHDARAWLCPAYPPTACQWRGFYHHLHRVPAQIGKGVLRREGGDVALIGYGTMVQVCVNSRMLATLQQHSRTLFLGGPGRSLSLLLLYQMQFQLCAKSVGQTHSVVVHMQTCMAAAEQLAKSGIEATVMDARFCKPLDESLIRQLAQKHSVRAVLPSIIGGISASE